MAEPLGQLGGDHPVRPRGPGDRHLLGHGGHATLEVGGRAGLLTEGGGGEHDVGPAGRLGEKRVHGDHPAGAREGPAGEIGIGAVGDRVDAEQDEQVRATVGGRFEDAETVGARTAGGQPELEGADDVPPAEGRQHLGVGAGLEHGSQGGHRRRGRLRQVGPAGDDHHRSGSELLLHRGVGEGGPEPGPGTGLDAHTAPGVAGQSGLDGTELEDPAAPLLGGVAQTQVEDGELLLEVRSEEHDRLRRRRFVDGGPRQVEELGRQPVADLGVAVVDADGVGEAGPGEGVLVRAACPAEQGDAARPARLHGVGDQLGGDVERGVPRRLGQPALAAHEGRAEPLLRAHGLEVEAPAVAQPTPVHGIGVHAQVAHELVAAGLDDDTAADRARRARALDLLEIPRPGLEPVGRGRERADGTDLHGVAREVRRERFVGEREDLGLVAPVGEGDERVAGDLVGEPGAPVTEDAALAVEQDEVADRDRLLEVALLLEVPALARAVAQRLVLQRALAALVADRAVERVVGEEQLEHALLGPLHALGRRAHDLAVGHVRHAADHHHRAPRPFDLDEALPAHADRRHPRVVAEAGHVHAGVLARVDDELAGLGLVRSIVDRHRQRRLGGRLRFGLGVRGRRHTRRRLPDVVACRPLRWRDVIGVVVRGGRVGAPRLFVLRRVGVRHGPSFRGSGVGGRRRWAGRVRRSARTRRGTA